MGSSGPPTTPPFAGSCATAGGGAGGWPPSSRCSSELRRAPAPCGPGVTVATGAPWSCRATTAVKSDRLPCLVLCPSLPLFLFLCPCLCVCLSVCLSVSLSVRPSLPPPLSVPLPLCLTVCPSVSLPLCLSVCPSVCSSVSTGLSVYRDKDALSHYGAAGAVTGGLFRLNLGLRGLLAGTLIGAFLGLPAGALVVSMQTVAGETTRDRVRRERSELYQLKLQEWSARLQLTDELIGDLSVNTNENRDLQRITELLEIPRNEGAVGDTEGP
uniref:Complex I assembly factor TIMMDC1, mitochondrial n=1 Tax=Gadus morhua TaxID=8049 RepID=A0A8C5C7E0_GADMO